MLKRKSERDKKNCRNLIIRYFEEKGVTKVRGKVLTGEEKRVRKFGA